jgi:hypothetical protein
MKDLIETIESIGFRELDIDFGSKVFEHDGVGYWSYPIKEYLAIQRENKLKELDIL